MRKLFVSIAVMLSACSIYAQKEGDPCVILNPNRPGSVTVGSYQKVTVKEEKSNNTTTNRTSTNSRSNNMNSNAGVSGKLGDVGGSVNFGISRSNSNSNSNSRSKGTTNSSSVTYTDKRCVNSNDYKTNLW